MAKPRTIHVFVCAERKDGSRRYRRDGSVVGARVPVPVVERIGAWAITQAMLTARILDPRRYEVTHVPTGRAVGYRGTLREARQKLARMAALPNQAAWKRLKHPRHMTQAMREQGSKAAGR